MTEGIGRGGDTVEPERLTGGTGPGRDPVGSLAPGNDPGRAPGSEPGIVGGVKVGGKEALAAGLVW